MKTCSAKASKCVRCGENHEPTTCPKEKQVCFRCGSEDHSPLDLTCPTIKKVSDKLNSNKSDGISIKQRSPTASGNRLFSEVLQAKENRVAAHPSKEAETSELHKKIEQLEKTVERLTETLNNLCANLEQKPKEPSNLLENLEESITSSIEAKVEEPLSKVTESTKRLTESLVRYIEASEERDAKQIDHIREYEREQEAQKDERKKDMDKVCEMLEDRREYFSLRIEELSGIIDEYKKDQKRLISRIMRRLGIDDE